jgi:hypothetical protein
MDLPLTSMAPFFALMSISSFVMDRVILQQVGHGGRIGQVIDGHDLHIGFFMAARNTIRPILPKPLIPILMLIYAS